MSDDIIDQLSYYVTNEMRMPAGLIVTVINEIERLRECLQHAIDHVGKWQLFTAEEKKRILAEYEKTVRGD
jgi:hypothetical protein